MSYQFVLDPSSPFVERHRGMLVSSICDLLDKLQSQGVASKLVLDSGAASFIELVLFDFIFKVSSRTRLQSAGDLNDYIVAYFPEPMRTRYTEAVMDLYQTASTGLFSRHSPSIVMPVDKLQSMLSRDILHIRADARLAKYLGALLQVIVNDMLVFVRRYVLELGVEVIGEAEARTAISADHRFLSIFQPDGAAPVRKSRSSSDGELDGASSQDDAVSMMSMSTLGPNSVDNISVRTLTPGGGFAPADEQLQLDYAEEVKRLLNEESANVFDLHMIIQVFKQALESAVKDGVGDLFGNVDEVLLASEAVLSTLEDTIEAAEESNTPLIGEVMLDLAGEAVLDVYGSYAETILSPQSQSRLFNCLEKQHVYHGLELSSPYSSRLRNYGDCFRYLLPRLLLRPLQHCWDFFDHLKSLSAVSPDSVDRNFLRQSVSVLHPLRARLKHEAETLGNEKVLQRPRRLTRQETLDQVTQLGKCLEAWSRDKPLQNCCTELIHEGTVYKYNERTRRSAPSERYVLLFDTLILLCKRSSLTRTRLPSSSVPAATAASMAVSSHVPNISTLTSYTYRVKEKMSLRNFRVTDLPNCSDYVNAFMIENHLPSESSTSSSISPTMFEDPSMHSSMSSMASSVLSSSSSASHTTSLSTSSSSSGLSLLSVGHTKGCYVLLAPSPQDKEAWMYHMLSVIAKPSIDRLLDTILNEQTTWHLPKDYSFSQPDNSDNIIFEETTLTPNGHISGLPPLIRGATLPKLIERLTYHEYSDTKFMKTFATTYRSFCKPRELLKLLIDRFNIPENSMTDHESASIVFFENEEEHRLATESRKFRKEYIKPVQFRVLNFIRHWLLNHSYDFSDDPELISELKTFIESISAPHLKRWVSRLSDHIRKVGTAAEERVAVFDQSKPPILYHLRDRPISLMTLHPIELARQVTLLEFAAFASIRPCELIGTPWTKSRKYELAPNVMRAIKFHTGFTFWLERNIVETKNLEERIAVCERICDVLAEFKNLNNFSGQFCIASAFQSGCVYRLALTMEGMRPEKQEIKKDAMSLDENHYREYARRLRMCNPPCVPFLGMWLSRLLHVEEGNRDFLADGVINFSKWRRTAEYITEIQQYQNQPYCLDVEPEMRQFFEKFDATDDSSGREQLEDYLYEMSYEIEPKQRNGSPPVFPREFDFPLTVPPPPALQAGSVSGTTSRRVSRDQLPRATGGTVASGRRGPVLKVPLVIPPSSHYDDSDGRSVATGGSTSSSSSLPSTPFPTPPMSASANDRQHFFASNAPPPLPSRPADTSNAPPPLPLRPLPSPSLPSNSNNKLASSQAASATGMPPPLPPRPRTQRSENPYTTLNNNDLPVHRRQNSE